jgi:protein-tyrosine phosphatase
MIPEGEDRAALVRLIRLSNNLTWGFGFEEDALDDIARIEEQMPPYNPRSTRVVHCGAGVGRTGTFIALDYLLFLLQDGQLDDIPHDRDPVAETVDRLRKQRMMMVEGESQFSFIYDVLKEEWDRRNSYLTKQGKSKEGSLARYTSIEETRDELPSWAPYWREMPLLDE